MISFSEWRKSEINENMAAPAAAAQVAPSAAGAQVAPLSPGDFRGTLNKLSIRLGEKANAYVPLLRFVSRNPRMLEMLEDLIAKSSTLQASTGKRLFDNN